MRYEDVAPGIGWLEQIPHTGIFKHHVLEPCCMCGSLTTFCEMNYQAPICSEECLRNLDEQAYIACMRGIE